MKADRVWVLNGTDADGETDLRFSARSGTVETEFRGLREGMRRVQ